MRIRIDLDQETTEKLIDSAHKELRPIMFQAEVILRRALGTWNEPTSYPVVSHSKTNNDPCAQSRKAGAK